MTDLQKKMRFLKAKGAEFGELWTVKMNSGKFGVPWERTMRILEQCGVDLKVVYPAEEEGEEGMKDVTKSKESRKSWQKIEVDSSVAKQSVSGDSTLKPEGLLEEQVQQLSKPRKTHQKKKNRIAEIESAVENQQKKIDSEEQVQKLSKPPKTHQKKNKRIAETESVVENQQKKIDSEGKKRRKKNNAASAETENPVL